MAMALKFFRLGSKDDEAAIYRIYNFYGINDILHLILCHLVQRFFILHKLSTVVIFGNTISMICVKISDNASRGFRYLRFVSKSYFQFLWAEIEQLTIYDLVTILAKSSRCQVGRYA